MGFLERNSFKIGVCTASIENMLLKDALYRCRHSKSLTARISLFSTDNLTTVCSLGLHVFINVDCSSVLWLLVNLLLHVLFHTIFQQGLIIKFVAAPLLGLRKRAPRFRCGLCNSLCFLQAWNEVQNILFDESLL